MKDIQKKNDEELTTFISEKREELRSLRFSVTGSGMRNVKAISGVKKDIAQALTEESARALKNEA